MGWPMAAYVQPVIEGWNVPYYPQAFSEPLPVGDSEGEAPQTKESRRYLEEIAISMGSPPFCVP